MEENSSFDFVKLIFCPDCWNMKLNILIIEVALVVSAFEKRIRSSAKRRCDRRGPDLLILIGFQLVILTS